MPELRAVWIHGDCICCSACSNSHPGIFILPDERAQVLGAVRSDGRTSDNEAEQAELNALGRALAEDIREAAAGCPVDAIRLTV